MVCKQPKTSVYFRIRGKHLITSPVPRGEIASLAHELRDDPVESGPLVTEASLPRAELSEVLCIRGKQPRKRGMWVKKQCHNVRTRQHFYHTVLFLLLLYTKYRCKKKTILVLIPSSLSKKPGSTVVLKRG